MRFLPLKRFPLHPKQPHRICWGCHKYCAADDLQCANGSIRIPHPIETDGDDWYLTGDWSGLLDQATLDDISAKRNAATKVAYSTPPRPQGHSAKPHIILRKASKNTAGNDSNPA